MNASTFFKSTTLVLALMGTMTCCANQSKKNAETEATTDKFESADWRLYNLRGKVKSCTESKVMAELVGTDQLKATDEENVWLMPEAAAKRFPEIKKTIENLDQEEKKTLTSILLTFEEARRETRRRNNR